MDSYNKNFLYVFKEKKLRLFFQLHWKFNFSSREKKKKSRRFYIQNFTTKNSFYRNAHVFYPKVRWTKAENESPK